MVKSMYAAVAGLNSHQSRMDVISNNIANVNTYGYKTKSTSFKESMYQTLTNGSKGSTVDGGYGATNPNLVGYGSMVSAIASNFTTGSPAETGNAMDCFIDGPAFFAVGPMFDDGAAQQPNNIYMTRVGDFAVRDGYLVDGNGRYVYGFTVTEAGAVYKDGRVVDRETTELSFTAANLPTGTGSLDAAGLGEKVEYALHGTDAGYMTVTTTKGELQAIDPALITTPPTSITNGNVTTTYEPDQSTPPDPTKMRVTTVKEEKKQIPLPDGTSSTDANGVVTTVSYKYADNGKYTKITEVVTPAPDNPKVHGPEFEDGRMVIDPDTGAYTMADGTDTLKPLKIPTSGTYVDKDGHVQREENLILKTYTISKEGMIYGTDANDREYLLGAVALVNVPNPAGMAKSEGPYYKLGGSSGEGQIIQTGGTAGALQTGKLEMSNVNIATEFSTMITTERGFQANSKIITVTDEMLQELVNMKR